MKTELLKFLKDNKHLYKLSAIEHGAGVPATTLSQVFAGRDLSEDHERSINQYIDKITKNNLKYLSKNFDNSK